MKKTLIISATIIVLMIAAILIQGAVPTPEEKDCLVVRGTVERIYEGGTSDVVFELEGHKQMFYVNRGLEYGLDIDNLKNRLIGKEVTIKHPEYWAWLDPQKSIRHISKIEQGSKVIFSEID